MADHPDTVSSKLNALEAAVSGGQYCTASLWGGAGVIVASTSPAQQPKGSYPDPRYVVTAHAAELSWLFDELWETFRPLLDHLTKIEFFGRLANAANTRLERDAARVTPGELLAAVLIKARAIADELEAGTFEALSVAPGGLIAEDLAGPEDRDV